MAGCSTDKWMLISGGACLQKKWKLSACLIFSSEVSADRVSVCCRGFGFIQARVWKTFSRTSNSCIKAPVSLLDKTKRVRLTVLVGSWENPPLWLSFSGSKRVLITYVNPCLGVQASSSLNANQLKQRGGNPPGMQGSAPPVVIAAFQVD